MTSKRLLFLSLLLLLTTTVLWLMAKPDPNIFSRPYFLNLTEITALWSVTLFSLSFLLSSRAPFLEKYLGGLDRLYKFHHQSGSLAFVLAILHPTFLILNALPDTDLAQTYLLSTKHLDLVLGRTALVGFTTLITLTIYIKLPYHIWKKTHEFMGLFFFLGILHMYFVESDVQNFLPLGLWMGFLTTIGLSSFFYIRFLFNFLSPRTNYLIKNVNVRSSITEITLTPADSTQKLSFQPGQFVFLKIAGMPEKHPFSLSSSPHQTDLRISAKQIGDYTQELPQILQKTQPATLYGPYGRFFEKIKIFPDLPLLLIAGGIGVTPFLSLLQSKHIQNRSGHFLYLTRNNTDNPYSQEIQNLLTKHPHLTFHEHHSDQKGYLDASSILKKTAITPPALIFLCGPPVMMKLFCQGFLQAGFRQSHIIFEDFDLA